MEMNNHQRGDDVAPWVANVAPSRGVSALPVVGSAASRVRQFYGDMAPADTDATEVRVAKEVFRWSSVFASAAAMALLVLDVPKAR